jgi:hypothetical protein
MGSFRVAERQVGRCTQSAEEQSSAFAMRTMVGMDAALGQTKTVDRATVKEVLLDNFFGVLGAHEAVPDCLGVDDHDWAMLALVKTSGAVDANAILQAGGLHRVLQAVAQLAGVLVGATGARGGFIALILADKEVVFVARHRP